MPDITVHRHGDRWAVREPGTESPTEELETREAAELAARRLADGGTVTVSDDDPTGLAEEQPEHVDTPGAERQESTANAVSGEGLARSLDAGL